MPVRNEERDLAPSIRRLHGFLRESFPFTARVTIADNGSTDRHLGDRDRLALELPERPGACHLDAARARPGTARSLGASERRRPRLHGRRPVDRPERAAPAGRAAAVRAQRPRDRHPAARGARVIRGPSASSSRAATTCCCARLLGARFSDAQCGFKAIRADRARALLPLVQRHRLVLRHRAAGARRAHRAADRTRCRWTGSMIPTRAWTSSRPPSRTCAASAGVGVGLAPRRPPGPRLRGPVLAAAGGGLAVAGRWQAVAPVHGHRGGRARSPTWCCSCCCSGVCPRRRRTCSACC